MSHLFPVFLNLEGKKCLVIGGGKVARRKVEDLFACGTSITVVSPGAEDDIRCWANEGRIYLLEREAQKTDLAGMSLVFVATDDIAVNQTVVNWCRETGIPVNAVDDPPNCDFFLPAVLRRDSLVLAISTEGKSPLLARRLRDRLGEVVNRAYGEYVEILGEKRDYIKATIPDIDKRRQLYASLVTPEILALVEVGDIEKVRERVEKCMSSWQE